MNKEEKLKKWKRETNGKDRKKSKDKRISDWERQTGTKWEETTWHI